MIRSEQTSNPSAHILKRSAKMVVERTAPTEFRVTPGEEGKLIRIVKFHQDDDGTVYIDCFAEDTGRDCEANTHARFCSHANAAIMELLKVTEGETDVTEQN